MSTSYDFSKNNTQAILDFVASPEFLEDVENAVAAVAEVMRRGDYLDLFSLLVKDPDNFNIYPEIYYEVADFIADFSEYTYPGVIQLLSFLDAVEIVFVIDTEDEAGDDDETDCCSEAEEFLENLALLFSEFYEIDTDFLYDYFDLVRASLNLDRTPPSLDEAVEPDIR